MKQDIDIKLPINYKCRPYQIPFWEAMKSGKKRAVLVWHRRAGKEKTCWNFLITKAVQKVGIYYYFFPHFSQGRKILWDGVDKDGFRLLDHIPQELIDGSPNSTEMKIRLKNGSLIQIIGTNNIDSIVGTNPVGCVFTEYSLQDPKAWQLIRPILVENGGWAVFNFTPRGANHGKDLYEMAKANPGWFCQILTVKDTGVVSDEDVQKERDAGMSEDFVQQEFFCSFTLGVEGSYYAKYLQEARDEGRISNVPWNKQSRVFTAWDLGYGDSCAIIFYQLVGQEIHVIDYYENHGEGLPHYAGILKDKPYIYADHFAPHDIESHSFSSGLSAKEVGSSLGLRFITLPTLKIRLEDGIEAVRGIFPRLWIDETKCKYLIKCLENYRKEFDQRLEVYKDRPRHDKYSHGCFVGETLIDCKGGQKRIDDIKQGDLVKTPNGYKKVLCTFEYESWDLLELKTSSRRLVCTPNHKIFTDKGLIYADAIRYNASLFTNRIWDKVACRMKYGLTCLARGIGFRESFLLAKTKAASCSTDTSFVGMEDIIEGVRLKKIQTHRYKDAYGLCITDKFHRATTSITLTAIPKTIASKILNVFQAQSTQKCICKPLKEGSFPESIFAKLWRTLKSGTQVLMASHGIKSTLKILDLEEETKSPKHATSAELLMKQKHITKDFAQTLVRQEADTCLGLIMKNAYAKLVSLLSLLTNTLKKERVLSAAPLSLQTTQKVYDFEVEDDHCYYANGILVSNSDATRYLAIAVKRNIDSAKDGIDDKQSERWFKEFNPRFD